MRLDLVIPAHNEEHRIGRTLDTYRASCGRRRTRAPPPGTAAPGTVESSDAGAAGEFGLDAARVPIRFAEDCDPAGRGIAARLWPELRTREGSHPLDLVAAAAAAHAAGERKRRNELLDAAERREQDQPTYYGAAWVALGRVLLTTDLAGRCDAR